jgi:ABC-2 type transport system permease protein
MRKIFTIVQREYSSRVFTKIFWVSVLLVPVGIGLLIFIPFLAATNIEKEKQTVQVLDESGLLLPALSSRADTFITYQKSPLTFEKYYSLDSAGKMGMKPDEVLLVVYPTTLDSGNAGLKLLYNGKLSIQVTETIERDLRTAIQTYRLAKLGIKENPLAFAVNLSQASVDENGNIVAGSNQIATLLGYFMSFLNYMMVFIYGMMVMRGVIEEKTSRIVEVILSSVKPFQLMAGKLIGICLVGLTQFVLWVGLSLLASFIADGIISGMATKEVVQAGQAVMPAGGGAGMFITVLKLLSPQLLLSFVFYFLGGFFLFGSLFAAIGSAVDQEQDAQQLLWPVTLPLIIPMLLLQNVLLNPNGSLAVFLSIFPFSSPTIMMIRLSATDVPIWQLLLSMALLIGGILACIWIAARIYRTGILMYGKKATIMEIGKWIWRS